ncbi:hypothetical protein MGYG_00752 [Nannizzia gypsea CBS 118893]|uniref:Amino acid permease 2 n=1 Tax=Arthroderma gypseum (strain ATCC MYA-4604 / CBS 118893) TaxID=535722 RepID=E5R1L4_ARTGP|nr:hypothetical protein MGYG_00752 [Nannizzia gypsea CBS 118893]EFQ97712.1 hypothetical protein MGYG_00752 [Nannizzia gypsea CBS 118893]
MGSHSQEDKQEVSIACTNADAEWNHNDEFKSSSADAADMRRMGKEQQLVRQFRFLSMASFVAVATASWEFTVFNLTGGITNGGRPMLIYPMLWNIAGFCPIYLSVAEMASMAPIAGAQYHWVSEFAPERFQRVLSYATGWTSTLAWQAGNASGVFLVATIIQVLISLHNEQYTFPQWHATLLAMMAVVVALLGNTFGARVLHMWQNAVFGLHILVYLGFIIPIWVNAPRASSSQVWTEFEFNGGWPSAGLAVLVGQQTSIFTQIGVDTAAHMAEEVRHASKAVPKAMISIWLVNSFLSFVSFITVAYHLPDVGKALADPTLYPIVHVLRQSMSKEWMTVLLSFILFLIVCSNMTYLAAVTRDSWAFARDQGLPFSDWIAKVNKRFRIPLNAIGVTSIISGFLSLIYIASPIAFYAMGSLITVALLQCYCLSIGCMLWRRIAHPETLPPATFSLGKFGIPINIAAVCYSLWGFFWTFWPIGSEISPTTFNWAPVVFVATLIVASIHFVFVARKKYFGPVMHIQGRNIRPTQH